MSRIGEALRRGQHEVKLPDAAGDRPMQAIQEFSDAAAAARELAGTGVPRRDRLESETAAQADPLAAPLAPASLSERLGPSLEQKVVVGRKTRRSSIEQYRNLAGALHQIQAVRKLKVVMVTSALAGEGKTLTATNLALTLSESYRRRVLLIDGDLRRPMLHQMFHVSSGAGLSDGLKADGDRKLPVVEVSTNLTVLPAGAPDPDPMGVLTSTKMVQLMGEASSLFDWVIVDTPPVGLMPDSNLLATMADGVILVVQAGRTPCAAIQRIVSTLGRERILGVVLNRVSDPAIGPEDQYYMYSARDGNGSHGSPEPSRLHGRGPFRHLFVTDRPKSE